MMVRWPLANSSSGPLVISTRSAFLAGGSTCAAAGWNASRLPTVVVIASGRSSAFMDVLVRGGRETDRSVSRPPSSVLFLRDGHSGERRYAADSRCTQRKRRRGDERIIPLGRRRSIRRTRGPGHARPRKGIDVGERCREAVREGLQEGHDLVLLPVRQGEIAGRHVDVVPDLGHWPAVHFFGCAWRTVP